MLHCCDVRFDLCCPMLRDLITSYSSAYFGCCSSQANRHSRCWAGDTGSRSSRRANKGTTTAGLFPELKTSLARDHTSRTESAKHECNSRGCGGPSPNTPRLFHWLPDGWGRVGARPGFQICSFGHGLEWPFAGSGRSRHAWSRPSRDAHACHAMFGPSWTTVAWASRCDPSVQLLAAGKVGHSCILSSVQGVTKV